MNCLDRWDVPRSVDLAGTTVLVYAIRRIGVEIPTVQNGGVLDAIRRSPIQILGWPSRPHIPRVPLLMHPTLALGIAFFDSEWVRAGAIFGAFFLAAMGLALVLRKILARFVAKTQTSHDDVIVSALRSLVVWALILAGGYYAVKEVSVVSNDTVIWPIIGQGFTIGWIILAVATTIRIFNAVSMWRIEQATDKGADTIRDVATQVNFIRKLLTAVVFFLGGLYILSIAGVDTSPIVAGGAVGGVVIGIALQDTLSNVFAGFFMNIDRPVKIGDFIRLEGGQEGFVEEVGWRYTKVRLWSNNLLIIPNNKLSQSIITNFNLPGEALSVYVNCGVAYDSDLDHVERVALDTAKEVMATVDGGDTTWEPFVRFKEFGDSSINFTVTLRAMEVSAQYRIHHQYVKSLHAAFNKEGIEIPFPIRTVIMKREASADE